MVSITDIKNVVSAIWSFDNDHTPFVLRLFSRKHPEFPTRVFYVEVTNKTLNVPLMVKAIRVCYGDSTYKTSFILFPQGTIEIKPKASEEFNMPYNKLAIQHTLLSKKPNVEPTYQPAPAKLFQAIMNGEPSHSWLEIDFNQYHDRKFKK